MRKGKDMLVIAFVRPHARAGVEIFKGFIEAVEASSSPSCEGGS